jgi:hypothetical protein
MISGGRLGRVWCIKKSRVGGGVRRGHAQGYHWHEYGVSNDFGANGGNVARVDSKHVRGHVGLGREVGDDRREFSACNIGGGLGFDARKDLKYTTWINQQLRIHDGDPLDLLRFEALKAFADIIQFRDTARRPSGAMRPTGEIWVLGGINQNAILRLLMLLSTIEATGEISSLTAGIR